MNSVDNEQERRIGALEAGQKQILELLEPIAETYKTANMLGKWTMGIMVFMSILLGVILSLGKLFHK